MKRPAGEPRAVPRTAWALALAGVVGAALVGVGGCAMSSGSSGGQPMDGGTNADSGADSGPGDAGSKAGTSGNAGAGGRGIGGQWGAAGAGGAGAPLGTGGSSAGAGGSTGAAGSSGEGSCYVTVEIVNPQLTSSVIEVGPDVRVQVKGTVHHSKSPTPTLTWTINSAAGLLTTAAVGEPDDNVVSFPATTSGNYSIAAEVANEPECSPIPLRLTGVRSSPGFNARVTASKFPTTEKVIRPNVTNLDVLLNLFSAFRIEPHAPGQPAAVMPAYLKISGAQSGLSIEGSTNSGALSAPLFVDQLYDLLIMPEDPSYAPDLVTAKPSSWIGPFIVDAGTPITGLVLGPDGAPLEGARMLLKQGSRPSTIGISDGSGMLLLRTRPGLMSAVVVPPPGSGLPQATVAGKAPESGVNLPANMSSLSITTQFQPVEQGALTLTILDPAGAKPVSGARVRIASQSDLGVAAILTAVAPGEPNTQQLTATGTVNAEVISDAAGRASFGRVPVGSYAVVVIPAAGSSQQAITSSGVMLQTTGVVPAAAATITLVTKVALSGTLSPVADAVGASVTAVDTGTDGGGGVASAVADAKGAFTLAVSPNRSYRIIVQPAMQSTRIRTVFSVDKVGMGTDGKPMTPPALMLNLQRGRPLTGTVKNADGGPVDQAFIQIFCVSSPSCVDPTLSLAETTSRGDGTFNVLIPDPDAAP